MSTPCVINWYAKFRNSFSLYRVRFHSTFALYFLSGTISRQCFLLIYSMFIGPIKIVVNPRVNRNSFYFFNILPWFQSLPISASFKLLCTRFTFACVKIIGHNNIHNQLFQDCGKKITRLAIRILSHVLYVILLWYCQICVCMDNPDYSKYNLLPTKPSNIILICLLFRNFFMLTSS